MKRRPVSVPSVTNDPLVLIVRPKAPTAKLTLFVPSVILMVADVFRLLVSISIALVGDDTPTPIALSTVSLVSAPIVVMLGCDAVCIVPVSVLAVMSEALTAPTTERLVRLPTDVMLGCEAVCSVPVIALAVIADALIPLVTVRLESVPRDVTLGCDAVCSAPEIVVAVMLEALTSLFTIRFDSAPMVVMLG